MRIEAGFTYPGAGVDRVFRMLTDPEFQRRKCAATGAESYDVEISGQPGAPVVRCRRTMSTQRLPDFVRRLARDGIEIIEVLTWRPDAGDGTRSAQLEVAFGSQPVRMTGSMTLGPTAGPAGAGAEGRVDGDLKVNVPLIGGRIEKVAAPWLLRALEVEQRVGREWLGEPAPTELMEETP